MNKQFDKPLKFWIKTDMVVYPERISETQYFFYEVGDRFIDMFMDENGIFYDGVVISNHYNPKNPKRPQIATIIRVDKI